MRDSCFVTLCRRHNCKPSKIYLWSDRGLLTTVSYVPLTSCSFLSFRTRIYLFCSVVFKGVSVMQISELIMYRVDFVVVCSSR